MLICNMSIVDVITWCQVCFRMIDHALNISHSNMQQSVSLEGESGHYILIRILMIDLETIGSVGCYDSLTIDSGILGCSLFWNSTLSSFLYHFINLSLNIFCLFSRHDCHHLFKFRVVCGFLFPLDL